MPDMLEQFAEEAIERFLKKLPPEKRIEGLTTDDLLAALSPEARAALAQRLKDYDSLPNPEASEPEQGDPRQ